MLRRFVPIRKTNQRVRLESTTQEIKKNVEESSHAHEAEPFCGVFLFGIESTIHMHKCIKISTNFSFCNAIEHSKVTIEKKIPIQFGSPKFDGVRES
jgi:hypothetical protein